jgi:hypothetical protein
MLREVKKVALWAAILLIPVAPCGVYLLSFRGEGLLGDLLGYLGLFIVLPVGVLYREFGIPSWVYLPIGLFAQYLWQVLWVAAARWHYLRKLKTAPQKAE